MRMQIFSFSPFGYEGALVTVEVDIRRGIPAVDIVGLADGAIKESRERMRAAVLNSGFDFPPERVLVSLSPADMRKEGAGFDLAIALAVLKARSGKDSLSDSPSVLVMGELELSGNVRGVRAVHAAASTAVASGIFKCIVPLANEDEAREVRGMKVYGAASLEDAFTALDSDELFTERSRADQSAFIPENCVETEGVLFPPVVEGFEFADVAGQGFFVRGLQIAAAGGHNLIAIGAPGCGKTMAMRKFQALLPLLDVGEAQPVTRIYSIAGLMQGSEPLVRIAPFREPHQTATIEGMCGGGVRCIPGEISLAHNGVLFLDEAAEFRSSVLQMLRVPIESGRITLARAGRSTIYPASFQLLMAANPCPCGNFGSKSKICLCSARAVETYWNKFSAPLLDRMDMRVFVDNEGMGQDALRTTTAELRSEIARAIKAQRQRQGKKNAKLLPEEIARHCPMSAAGRKLLDNAAMRCGFSPRAVASSVKIARTIADMALCSVIQEAHVKEAVQYRKACAGFLSENVDG